MALKKNKLFPSQMPESNIFLIYYKSVKIEHPLNYCFPYVTKYSAWSGIIRPPELPL